MEYRRKKRVELDVPERVKGTNLVEKTFNKKIEPLYGRESALNTCIEGSFLE